MIDPSEISDILKQQLDGLKEKAAFEEVGTVLNVGDGVAHVYGLENVEANELVTFENGATGVAMNLEESNVGVGPFSPASPCPSTRAWAIPSSPAASTGRAASKSR